MRWRPTSPGGVAPNEYDVRRNPDLAHTYRMIAEGGRDVFYDGPIAQTIDAYFKRIGGWLSPRICANTMPSGWSRW